MNFDPARIRQVVSEEDDFAHEMAVAAILSEFPSYESKHGGTYSDTQTGKSRQFDFRAVLSKGVNELFLSVECKKLNERSPLVICGRPRTSNEAFHDFVWSRNGNHTRPNRLISGASSETMRAKSGDSIYAENDFCGKSLLRLKGTNDSLSVVSDSDIYDKWAQAISSISEAISGSHLRARDRRVSELFLGFIPIVVLPDNVLWICPYNKSGGISSDPSQVDECSFFVGKEGLIGLNDWRHRYSISHIHFMTLKGFRSFLSRMAINQHSWSALFTADAKQL